MSTLYQDLPLTQYPGNLDTFTQWLNVTATDGPLIQQYITAMNAGNQTLANQILSQISSASQKIITATDLNTMTQAIQAVERFYKTDIEPYIQTQQESWLNTISQFSYKGTWSNGTSYATNNIVSYTTDGLVLLFIATSNPPTGTVPTNTQYWRLLTIQGQPGPSGVGLSYRQEWNSATQYSVNDSVTYDGDLWMALQSNQNVQPGTNSSYWQIVISFETTTYPIQDTEPVGADAGSLWFNTQNNPTKYYYLETLNNPITQDMIPEGYQTYGAGGVVLNGTGPLPIVSGGTNATTPQQALANLGAGVRPNLLDNWYFVGGGSQQGGGQFPINQRGAVSGDLSEDSYIIDRWQVQAQLQNVSYSIDADGVSITTSAGNQGLKQHMEVNRLIPGETYTSTVLLADGTLMTKTFTLSEQGSAGMYYDGSQWSCAIVPGGTLWVYFPVVQYVGDLTIKIAAAKLENGPTQTLAYQDEDGNWQLFETPDYGEELAKCQRLQIMIRSECVFRACFVNANYIDFWIPLPTTMRILPTVNSGNWQIRNFPNMDIETGFTVVSQILASNGIRLRATKNSHGLTDAVIRTIENALLDSNL